MIYTAAVAGFLLICVGLGSQRWVRFDREWVAAALALAMVAAQFALLMTQ